MKNDVNILSVSVWTLCILVISIFYCGSALATNGHHYWIKEHVAVSGDVITFEDIAEPRSYQAGQKWDEVKNIQLWRAPQAGQRIVLHREQVVQRLRAVHSGLAETSIVPREITFQRGEKVYSSDELEKMVVSYLKPRVQSMAEDIEFRDFRLPAPVYLENAFERIEMETTNEPGPGRVSFRLNVIDAHGSISRRLTGNVFIDAWQTVACASRPLNRGDIINPDDVRFERKNLAYLRNDVWDGRTGPWRVRSAIGQGQPILQRALESVPVVSRGDRVNLVYQGQHVTLSVPVQVLEDGGRGDTITVRNMSSRKEIIAVVQDGGTVLVR